MCFRPSALVKNNDNQIACPTCGMPIDFNIDTCPHCGDPVLPPRENNDLQVDTNHNKIL